MNKIHITCFLSLTIIAAACGKPLKKCPSGSDRAWCGVRVYSASKPTQGEGVCVDAKRDIAVTFCQKKVSPGAKLMNLHGAWERIQGYIAQTWNTTFSEFLAGGGVYASPITADARGKSINPCFFQDDNPYPGSTTVDIDVSTGGPGSMLQGLGGGAGGSDDSIDAGPMPDFATCMEMCTPITSTPDACSQCAIERCCDGFNKCYGDATSLNGCSCRFECEQTGALDGCASCAAEYGDPNQNGNIVALGACLKVYCAPDCPLFLNY